ncbi:DUF5004 domain-containing protein [Chitinophaga sp.]|uniref:DUF5004 domain-containing protein n=1 Tax=Chitinophaga sp. TaxID=1869181 RepID=UPI0031E3ABF7
MNRYFILSVFWLMLFSCKIEEVSPVGEAPKNISGSWKILKATRNGTDITQAFDFSLFRVKFDSAGNYTITNRVPFLVNANGTYALDDPAYPFKITFTPQGGTAIATSFNYITTAGIRQLNLTFVPGCELNAYIYTLEKDN